MMDEMDNVLRFPVPECSVKDGVLEKCSVLVDA